MISKEFILVGTAQAYLLCGASALTLGVELNKTVAEVRERACSVANLDPYAHRLSFPGNYIEDPTKTLWDSGIHSDCLLCLIPESEVKLSNFSASLFPETGRQQEDDCGALDSNPSSYLLTTKELRQKCVTGGYPCRPICKECFHLKGAKGVVKWGRKDALQERKEKEQKQANKEKSK